ncbi:hypothetical protein [Pelagibacterium sp. H642]|uniref:hypothetical protein n=1 Tax=Pelagibacterium sp. H642 TaxID=1881069 RepID=UPI002815E4BC|nr:hypothetical protein [Pelagibacterium sp. H642]WMT90159.1 hypothetical protein NO934_15380 [Pelagibacterium sp. H642]
MRNVKCAVLFILAAAGTASAYDLSETEMSVVEDGVRNELRDPDSARFDTMLAEKGSDDLTSVCGFVNAKNGYGGYTGMVPYLGNLLMRDQNRGMFFVTMIGDDAAGAQVVYEMCAEKGIQLSQ